MLLQVGLGILWRGIQYLSVPTRQLRSNLPWTIRTRSFTYCSLDSSRLTRRETDRR